MTGRLLFVQGTLRWCRLRRVLPKAPSTCAAPGFLCVTPGRQRFRGPERARGQKSPIHSLLVFTSLSVLHPPK